MKVMLSEKESGKLSIYVPKKDLEEAVIEETTTDEGTILTLANGWKLAFDSLTKDMKLPQTLRARRL